MNDKNHSSNNSTSVFILGFILGIAAALLFTTKKGRKILRTLTDEGITKFSGLEEIFEKKMQREDEEEMVGDMGEDYVSHEERAMVIQPQETITHASIHTVRPHARRFFRGAKRM